MDRSAARRAAAAGHARGRPSRRRHPARRARPASAARRSSRPRRAAASAATSPRPARTAGPSGISAGCGPTSRKTSMPSACRARETLGESNRHPRVASPVRGRQLSGPDEAAADVRDHGDLRLAVLDARRLGAEGRQGGLHHRRVEGVRHRQRPDPNAVTLELRADRADRRHRPREHHLTRRVHGGDRHVRAVRRQVRRHLRLGQPHRGHGARRQRLHQPPAQRDEAGGVVQREDAGDAGRRVLADAVTDHGRRLDAPRAPQRGERVLDREQRRLGVAGSVEIPRARRRRRRGSPASGRSSSGSSAAAQSSSARRKTGSRLVRAARPSPRTASPAR